MNQIIAPAGDTKDLMKKVRKPVQHSRRAGTRHEALLLGCANLVVSFVMFVSPMVLTRVLDKTAFADYRLLWLLANTAQLLAPLGLPRSLMYFMPRLGAEERVHYVTQTLVVLLVTGVLSALLVSPANPLLPEKFRVAGWLVPAFILVWVVSSILEMLPISDFRVSEQSILLVTTSAVRLVFVIGVAWLTHDIRAVMWAVLGFGVFKLALLLTYIYRWHGLKPFGIRLWRIKEHLGYAVPFGGVIVINNLRRHMELWIVASMFTPELFGVFSIGAMELPLLNILRRALSQIVFPKLSKAHNQIDYSRLLYLNQSANLATAFVVFPITAFVLFFARPLVDLLFPSDYADAALIFQIYLGMTAVMVLDVGSIMMVFNQRAYVIKISLALLLLSCILSLSCAKLTGMAGAAAGSLIAQVIYAILLCQRAGHLLNVSLRKFQDWKGMAHAFAGSLLAAAGVYILYSHIGVEYKPFLRIMGAGALFGGLYLGYLKIVNYWWVVRSFLNRGEWGAEFKAPKTTT